MHRPHRSILCSRSFLCSLALISPVALSAQAPPPHLEIVREVVRMGREAPHALLESRWAGVFRLARVPVYYLGMTSIWGPSEAWFISGHESYRGWEDLDTAIGSAEGLDAQTGLLASADAENISSTTSLMAHLRPELGRGGVGDLARARYLEITVYQIRPGRVSDFEKAAQLYQKFVTDSKVSLSWAVYEVTHGMPGPVFLVIVPRVSLSELDSSPTQVSAAKGMTAEGMQAFNHLAADGFLTVERKLFRLRPGISNPSPEFSAGDPDFWRVPPD